MIYKKKQVIKSTFIVSFLSVIAFTVFSQSNPSAPNFVELQLDSKDIGKFIEHAGDKRIVAMGEGTHGTKEFNEIRSLLTQRLIKEKQFNYVLFESSYGGALGLDNDIKNNVKNLPQSMKLGLTAIFQTKEIERFLNWVSDYNKQSVRPVKIGGIDYAELTATFDRVRSLLANHMFEGKDEILRKLQIYVSSQDSAWNNLNRRRYKLDRTKWMIDGIKAYKLISNIEAHVDKNSTADGELKVALLNLKLGFETIHLFTTRNREASRDSCMAEMVHAILVQNPDAKIIVWAHNAHIANKPVYPGNNGGGMGAYLQNKYRGNYFSIATITGWGTYSATNDAIPTRFNRFSVAKLRAPIDGSLEKMYGYGNRFIFTKSDSALPDKISMRFVGYRPKSGTDTFVEVQPQLLYDAIIYIGKTRAAEHF